MQIYLAGPMSNIPYFNYPAFDAEAKHLRSLGHEVFNPAEHDVATYGADISNPTGSVEQAIAEYGFDRAAALKADLSWICDHADAIVLLPGWEKSSGAKAELALADALGLRVFGPDLTARPLLGVPAIDGTTFDEAHKILDGMTDAA